MGKFELEYMNPRRRNSSIMTMSHHITQKKRFLLAAAAVVVVSLLFFSEQHRVHPSTCWPVGDSEDHKLLSTWRQHPTEIVGSIPVVVAFSPTRTTTATRTSARILYKNRLLINSAPVTSFGSSSWPKVESSLSSFTSDTTTSSSSSTLTLPVDDEDEEKPIEEQFFFIRPALMADIGKASQILTDGFFTLTPWNFLGYFYERLLTFLSLEATCSIIERSNKVTSVFQNLNEINNNGNDLLSGPQRQQQQQQQGPMKRKLFVACQEETGVVLGMVEVDARAQREPSSLPNIIRNDETNQILPYMCNLAIDGQYKRRGIAKALVNHCEEQVLQWYDQQPTQPPPSQIQQVDSESDNASTINFAMPTSLVSTTTTSTSTTSIENSLSLKVRMTNDAAIALYENLGYDRIQQQTDPKTNEVLLLMKKKPLER